MGKLCSFTLEELKSSWEKIKTKGGAAKELSFEEIKIDDYLNSILEQLNAGVYSPDPVQQYVQVNQPASKQKNISILSIRDRIVQQTLVNRLNPLFEPDFLDCSFAYRRGRSALMAVEKVQVYIGKGNLWILETDIDSFFESMDHNLLITRLLNKVDDQKIIDLVLSFLKAPQFKEMNFTSVQEGVSIGGIISPLLSNIYLHPLDVEMDNSGYNYVRYSDDMVVLGRQKEEIQRALLLIKQTLKKLSLNLNKAKTRIGHVSESFDFLGFRFDQHGRGPALKAIEALQQNIAIATGKQKNPEAILYDLELLLVGWQNYYGTLTWLVPKDYIVLLALVKMAVSGGNINWAEKLLSYRSKTAGKNADLCCMLAGQWLELGWVEEVVVELAEALHFDDGHEQALFMLNKTLAVDSDQLSTITEQLKHVVTEPGYAAGYYNLSEIYLQSGLFKLAQLAHARGTALESMQAPSFTSSSYSLTSDIYQHTVINFSREEVERFLHLFTGRDDIYAYEQPGHNQERLFTTVRGCFSEEQVKGHLNGEFTLATYLIRENHTVRLMVIDIDVSKKLLLEKKGQAGEIEALINKTQTDANRIKSVADEMGVDTYFEDSGYRGRHCWFFFEKPLEAKKARILGRALMRKAGAPSGGVTWELFPGTDRLKNTQTLNRIKLPFGKHPKSDRRGLFVDESGIPFANQGEYLHLIKPISVEVVEKIVAVEDKKEEICKPSRGNVNQLIEKKSPLIEETPNVLVKAVLKGCSLVKYQVLKAESTSYLPHLDRQSLLHVFAHLGDEGKQYLHRVMACCLNYDYKITQKHIDRLPEKPISCGRLRERYKQLSASLNCNCRFGRLPDTYPSPILHAVKKNNKQSEKVNLPLVDKTLPNTVNDRGDIDVEAIIKKMQNLRRQQQGIKKSLNKCEQLLSKHFDDQKTDCLPVEAGKLTRICDDNNQIKWIIEI